MGHERQSTTAPRHRAPSAPRRGGRAAHPLLSLQAAAGNAATTRLVTGASVQRLAGTGNQDERLRAALGAAKAKWILDHPTLKPGPFLGKSAKVLSQYKQLPMADFKAAFPLPESGASTPAEPTTAAPTTSATPSAVTVTSTPAPAVTSPVAVPPVATKATDFTAFLGEVDTRAAAAKTGHTDRYKTMASIASAIVGKRYRLPDSPRFSAYKYIAGLVPGLEPAVAALDPAIAEAKGVIGSAGDEAVRMQALGRARQAVLNVEGQLQQIVTQATAYATRVNTTTVAGYPTSATLADHTKAASAPLKADLAAGRVMVGARLSDYRSAGDTTEGNSFGASYSLLNTPYVLHLHATGSGTSVDAMSVKLRTAEYGSPVLYAGLLKKENLWDPLWNSVTSAEENPRQIGLDRRAGKAAPGRRW